MLLPPDSHQLRLFEPPAPRWLDRHHPNSLSHPEDELEGGAYDYARAPELFLGRSGTGPLRVAWDTNVLIDYASLSPAVWEDDSDASSQSNHGRLSNEQSALVDLMHIWMVRDIRIHVFARQLDDFRTELSDDRLELRTRQVEQIQSALGCLGHGTDLERSWFPLEVGCTGTPPGMDTELIELSVNAGCHVFLTCDKGILRSRSGIGRYGVLILRPSDLLRAFGTDGWLFGAAGPFPMPDNHKWLHLMAACG